MTKSDWVNETILKFGYPETLVAETDYWLILLRPRQATLGALILAHKGLATSWAEIEAGAFQELKKITSDLENALAKAVDYKKLNYLMLMMVDPHVHFHVLPRYDCDQRFGDTVFPDSGWPGPPDLGYAPDLDPDSFERLRQLIRDHWT